MTIRGVKRASGYSLIEVLVSLLVIAIGVLGAVALQAKAVQAALEASQRSHALLLVQDMVDRIKNNRDFAGCYSEGTPGCNTLSNSDLLAWRAALEGAAEIEAGSKKAAILQAVGCIDSRGSGIYTVSVAWQGLTRQKKPGNSNECGATEGESEEYRRVISMSLRIADLN